MSLPQFQDDNRSFQMLQSTWASQLDPVLKNPTTNPLVLKNIAITTGVNIINHKLGRIQQGWVVADQTSAATLYRSAPLNNLTLTLTASAPSVVTLLVF